jgi:glycine cleavage system H protein
MKFDPACKYTRNHEWVRPEGDEATIGITDYAQEQLSDIVYVDLPEVGDSFEAGEVFATVESVKAASDVYMPIGGEIVATNGALEDTPEVVNKDPFGEAWLVRISIAEPGELDELLDVDAYKKLVEES